MEYDYLAEFYDAFIDQDVYEKYLDFISKYTTIGSVLDIGCGTGNLSLELARWGYDVVATDLSESMLHIVSRRAQDEGLNIEVGVYDLLDPLDEKFDLIIASMDVINHLSDLEDVRFGFNNIINSLKENGIFIFDVLSVDFVEAFDGYEEKDEDYSFHWVSRKGNKPHSIIHKITVENIDPPQEIEIHEQTHEFEEYETVIRALGFNIIETHTYLERKIYVLQKPERTFE